MLTSSASKGDSVRVVEIKGARKPVVTVPVTADVSDVTRAMRQYNIAAVVVLGDTGDIVGLITEREIALAVGATQPAAVNLTARQLMTSPVLTCALGDRLAEVMQTMLKRRVRHLPLVDDGRLVGMVSVGDVMKNLLEHMQTETNVLRDLYLSASSR
jgi:CBS domain-containing protein